jgi:hypothetical protein
MYFVEEAKEWVQTTVKKSSKFVRPHSDSKSHTDFDDLPPIPIDDDYCV